MSGPLLAIVIAVALALLHFRQVDMLSDSYGEYWKRTDEHARASKVFFSLSLASCGLILLWPIIGIGFALAFILLSIGFSMNEWKS